MTDLQTTDQTPTDAHREDRTRTKKMQHGLDKDSVRTVGRGVRKAYGYLLGGSGAADIWRSNPTTRSGVAGTAPVYCLLRMWSHPAG